MAEIEEISEALKSSVEKVSEKERAVAKREAAAEAREAAIRERSEGARAQSKAAAEEMRRRAEAAEAKVPEYTPQIVYKVAICPRGNLPYIQITSIVLPYS